MVAANGVLREVAEQEDLELEQDYLLPLELTTPLPLALEEMAALRRVLRDLLDQIPYLAPLHQPVVAAVAVEQPLIKMD